MGAWNDNTTATALVMVKTELGIMGSEAYDTILTQYIEAAKDDIERQGVSDLADDVPDAQLVAALASWSWLNRDKDGDIPVYIRKRLNNRIFGPKMRTAD